MELGAREVRMRVREVRGAEGLAGLAGRWDALAEAVAPGQPFHRHAFIRAWLDAFARQAPARILVVESDDGRLEAVLPLVSRRQWQLGMPVRGLTAAANAHSCRFDLLAREPGRAAGLILDHLTATGGFDRLLLYDVPEGGGAQALAGLAAERGLPVGRWESLRSPHFDLPADMEQLRGRLDTRFKANLRRRRRKLAQKGTLALERFSEGPGLAARLEEGFALERSGWKGRRGTAIAQDSATRRFYESLAAHAAREGTLALYFLRLGARAVAFQFGLERAGRYFLLKPGFDEALGDCSPGQLLMEDVVEDLIDRGVGSFDFLGPDMPWKREWAESVRVHSWWSVFPATPYGRALHAAKFRAAPAVKEVLGRWLR